MLTPHRNNNKPLEPLPLQVSPSTHQSLYSMLSCIMWGCCELTIDDLNIRDERGEEEGEGAEDTMELELKGQDRNRIQSQNPESESR